MDLMRQPKQKMVTFQQKILADLLFNQRNLCRRWIQQIIEVKKVMILTLKKGIKLIKRGKLVIAGIESILFQKKVWLLFGNDVWRKRGTKLA
mgnify:CR=1 FL=1